MHTLIDPITHISYLDITVNNYFILYFCNVKFCDICVYCVKSICTMSENKNRLLNNLLLLSFIILTSYSTNGNFELNLGKILSDKFMPQVKRPSNW